MTTVSFISTLFAAAILFQASTADADEARVDGV